MLAAKLKGGALYIAIIICLVIAIILSIFILIAHFNQKQVLAQLASDQLSWDLRSAINIAQSGKFDKSLNNIWFKTQFGDDSIKIKFLQWGAYLLIEMQAKNSHGKVSEAGIYGSCATPDTALSLVDGGRLLNLAGSVKFNGAAYFPQGGFKSAYIEGVGSVIDPSINEFIRVAGQSIRQPSKEIIKRLLHTFKTINEKTEILGNFANSSMQQSFSAKTLVIRSGNINLSGFQLSDNIKLIANNEIIIDKTTQLNNVLLIATKVHFKKDFTGTVHVLASDSIIVEDGCFLRYPSSLTVVKETTADKNLKGIFIGKKCRVEGSVIAIKEGNDNPKVYVKTESESMIYGMVYSSDYASLQGKLYGTLYCSKLLLQTPSAVYENHLFNLNIDPKKFASSIFIPSLFEKSKVNKCIKRL